MSLPPVIDLGENAPIVIDNGSGWMKAGYSCDDRPRCILPTMVGRKNNKDGTDEETQTKRRANRAEKECYVGEEAQLKTEDLVLKFLFSAIPPVVTFFLSRPIEKGVITNWDYMVRIWHYIFTTLLHTQPETHPLLLTEAARNPPKEREKMTEIMFETFRVPCLRYIPFYTLYRLRSYIALYSQAKEVLALYTSGQTTGVVVDCGEAATTTVPIYEGYKISSSIKTLDIAGRKLTGILHRLLISINALLLILSRQFTTNHPFLSCRLPCASAC